MTDELRNEVVVTLEGRDISTPMESLGVSMDSTQTEILDAVRGIVQEAEGVDISDDAGEYSYTVRKADNSGTIYVYPKPVAG